jgi:LysR family hydrogen peroxide-inducible transcriptional activator
MEFRQLEYFVSLAQTGTFSEAAERVHVSQPALSQQIQKLEDELGVPLVERMGKSIKLTENGEKFLPEAMEVLDSVRSAENVVNPGNTSLEGTLKLGVIPTIAPYALPALINRLEPGLNEVNIHIEEQQTETLLDQLKIGAVDHILLSPPFPEDGLRVERLGREPFYLAVHRDEPIAGEEAISTEDITDEPILLLEEGHCLRDQTLSFCQNQNVQPNVVFQGSNLQSILNLIETGFGYTFVPEMVVDNVGRSELEFIPFADPKPERAIVLARRQSTELTDLDRHLYDLIEDWFQ